MYPLSVLVEVLGTDPEYTWPRLAEDWAAVRACDLWAGAGTCALLTESIFLSRVLPTPATFFRTNFSGNGSNPAKVKS